MNTVGRDKWPNWVKRAIGDEPNIEIKEHRGRYYAYRYKSSWDRERKRPTRTSEYLGVVTRRGLRTRYEATLKGVYEYGHVAFVWRVLEENGILESLTKNFPDEWRTVLIFAMNRLIDPRPMKSMKYWYEKTYLAKQLPAPVSPKTISNVLERIGGDWNSQLAFFQEMRRNGEKLVYDGSVIFSSSKENPILEVGYNKDKLLLPKANVVMAFSHDRFFPVFFRVLPGSIHEITTLDVLLEELGENMVLVMDKGFTSIRVSKKIHGRGLGFIMPLKRNSAMIDYDRKLGSFFMYRKRPIKYCRYEHGEFFIYLCEDLALRSNEEKTYFTRLSRGREVEFKEKWAGKIALLSNLKADPKEIYEMWKIRDEVEKAFNVLQNMLDTDRPYVRKEHTFRGYLFSSFIGLVAYYLILKKLKDADLNGRVSVSDALLELSKVYKLEIGKKEMISERSKRVRKLLKVLGMKNLITKTLRS
jgi:transposase